MSKDGKEKFEYRIIAENGSEKRLISDKERFQDNSNSSVELDDIISGKRQQNSASLDSTVNADLENITSALYQIADNVHATEDMDQFFEIVHKTVASLTYAENFFIALYEQGNKAISFPYSVDSVSDIDVEYLAKLPFDILNNTLTGHMLRTGKMLHADVELIDSLEQRGEVNEIGKKPYEWLGFPLKRKKVIIGAMVVQTYLPDVKYTKKDIELLQFVSQHVASAIARKMADEALRDSERKFREVLENSRVVSYKINLPAGLYEYISPSVEEIMGYSPDQIINMDYLNIESHVHPQDRKKYRIEWPQFLNHSSGNKKSAAHSIEYRWRHKENGEYSWFSETRTPVYDEESGKISAIVGSIQDITDIKFSEQKLLETELALHKIQELENIGVLAGGLAHDFNNMLTGVFGNISLAKMKLSIDHPGYEHLIRAEKAMDRAKRLTGQLLTFSKGGEPHKEEVGLTRLIKEMVTFDLTGSNVKPSFNFSENISDVYVDKGQIQQVISNLVINADQAMPDGGLIYIAVEKIDMTKKSLQIIMPGSYIRVKIQDEGQGMDRNVYEKIFDPYFTTKSDGSGLGLTTVFSIIKKHDGHITVNSEPGKGTTIYVYLPYNESLEKEEQLKTEDELLTADNINILVMDDDEDILSLVTSILEINNYSVTTALDGEQMLQKYQQSNSDSKPFDLVIMDLTIPGGMGGKEAIVELLKFDDKAKCVVSSGYAEDSIMANFLDYGFKAAISKPYVLDELNRILQEVINLD